MRYRISIYINLIMSATRVGHIELEVFIQLTGSYMKDERERPRLTLN